MTKPINSGGFAVLLQTFFADHLINQRNLSKGTLAAYRDTFRLLLQFLERYTGTMPAALTLDDLCAQNLLVFLDHLEEDRGNTPRTRNARLASIRTFLHFASRQKPEALQGIQRALAIPMKRFERPLVGFLSREEMHAVLDAPDPNSWSGRRDRVLWAVMYNTGARVSEVTGLCVRDLSLARRSALSILGKGRKHRVVPLWRRTTDLLRDWLKDTSSAPEAALFPNVHGQRMTRSGVEQRLRVAVQKATSKCPSLTARRISPHTIRHTSAMHLLQSGVALPVIALWLGHESPETTHMYLEADLAMKEAALSKLKEPNTPHLRYKPRDPLLGFLDSL